MNKETLILKRKEHGFDINFYDYSKLPNHFIYQDKIEIICPIHGPFIQKVHNHIVLGSGCPKCGFIKNNKNRTKTTEEFIQKAQKVHQNPDGTPKYDYSKTNYIKLKNKITVTCPIHGDFEIYPANHLYGTGCQLCREKINSNKFKKLFIQKSQEIHKNLDGTTKYDYSQINYVNNTSKIKIICPIHGEFEQNPSLHLMGYGCSKCKKQEQLETIKKNFIEKAQEIHKNLDGTPKYDYSQINYIDSILKVKIICPIHGEFMQGPANHLQGHGCPTCGNKFNFQKSQLQTDLENWLKQNYNGKIISNYRNLISKEIDIYLYDLKIGIELNGLHWHSDEYKTDDYHISKTKECDSKNVQLIQIFEDEWVNKQNIVKSRLKQILHIQDKSKRIYARNCYIKQVSIEDEKQFLENNHLQGYIPSKLCYGLYWKSTKMNKEYLVGLMSFGDLRKNLGNNSLDYVWELYRFCIIKDFQIIGGASKLFKYFINKFNPKQIISYADRRWSINSDNNLYNQLGFKFDSYTDKNYWYFKEYPNLKRINRFKYRKDILISKYNCSEDITERKFMLEYMGMRQIYDCGNLKYIWVNNNFHSK